MQNVAEVTLHSGGSGHDGEKSSTMPGRPVSEAWITDELVLYTRKVWSNVYGRVVSTGEAVEILLNVKRLAEVLMQVDREGTSQ